MNTKSESSDKSRQLNCEDQCQIIPDLRYKTRIKYGTCKKIVPGKLGMRRNYDKLVPRLLTMDENVCSDPQGHMCVIVEKSLSQKLMFEISTLWAFFATLSAMSQQQLKQRVEIWLALIFLLKNASTKKGFQGSFSKRLQKDSFCDTKPNLLTEMAT
ncbi:hypothetical protein CEXT_144291 [Caerostris extrusa]|uniref:Uncharacterized protein n=1 Tax=Caerostris extrusa TaxID=172846 RepID=A0AAV4Y6W5_CAEEX|nr:hypothetical protein CEXT_144291 [Caerostris extrusa]